MNKRFITANELLEDSFLLASKVLDSGFVPTFIIAIWRGGAPIGIAMQEFLAFFGVEANHIAVRTSSYLGIGEQAKQVQVHGLGWAIKNLRSTDKLLLVDDVHDTGLSVAELIRQIEIRAGNNTPHEIKFAAPYFKPRQSKTSRIPDFYVHETNEWLVFPHELLGLSSAELEQQKPHIAQLRERLLSRFDRS